MRFYNPPPSPTPTPHLLWHKKDTERNRVWNFLFFFCKISVGNKVNCMWRIILEFHIKLEVFLPSDFSFSLYSKLFEKQPLLTVLNNWFIISECWISYLTFLNCLYFAFTRNVFLKLCSSFLNLTVIIFWKFHLFVRNTFPVLSDFL